MSKAITPRTNTCPQCDASLSIWGDKVVQEDGSEVVTCSGCGAQFHFPPMEIRYAINRDDFVHLPPTESLNQAFAELQRVAATLRNKDLTYYLDMIVNGDLDGPGSMTLATLRAGEPIVFAQAFLEKIEQI